MKVKLLCLVQPGFYIHGAGMQNRFEAVKDHRITELPNGNYRVQAFGQDLGIPQNQVQFVIYESEEKPAKK